MALYLFHYKKTRILTKWMEGKDQQNTIFYLKTVPIKIGLNPPLTRYFLLAIFKTYLMNTPKNEDRVVYIWVLN